MRNIKLTVAYDGTDFHGWQMQPGKPTIQGTLVDVARKLTQENVYVFAAGRTDAGVHALGQVVHFRTQSHLKPEEFLRAFNALLPKSIRVLAAEEATLDFHARWNAVAKTYLYRIHRGRIVSPFDWRYALHYPFPLDEEAMAQCAKEFEGEHDFTSFAASSGSEEVDADRSTLRMIYSATVTRRPAGWGFLPVTAECGDVPADGYELVITLRGKSFLRYMVRKMVGTLLEVGRGKFKPGDIARLFELKDRSQSGPTVPPHGLFLVSVEYPPAWWKEKPATPTAQDTT